MDQNTLIGIAVQAMIITAKLAAPMVLTALVIGFAVSLLQSVTQIQEVTLSFIPKAIGVAIALLVCGSWMISEMVTYTELLFKQIPSLLNG
ncbi:flagellar biosynthetic protein FliQ [Curtobacterium sp. MCBD17_040]|uniref:flagellar biosynthetic protein FliQ n=1 Tax=Curtobacterium sp. MCBD17_040 TaxID=2175674 RepID=UPI000DA7E222|nr:flagellar biosynthetic protein FliQ [Curtobacterium sp. MCBD17_040]WIB65590.1 flagellar biosynthetic protein FliQ [Curtobacterium sp. MCBD17_040]